MKENQTTKAAVIYLGSSALYMNIAEKEVNKSFRVLEKVEYPLNLGHDTFVGEKIQFEKVDEMCKTLINFKKLINDYQVKLIKVIATTAIREAKNRDYILDQIKIKTGLQVEVLDDSEEKKHIYRGVLKRLNNNSLDFEQSLIAYIGTGRLGVATYKTGNITSSQNIRVGSLKLSEILGEIQEKTNKFYIVVEEYLSSFTYMLKSFLPQEELDHFIASGKEIELISELCGAQKEKDFSYISKEKFLDLYNQIKDKTPNQIKHSYSLSAEKSEILLPAMAIYKTIFNLSSAKRIIVPGVSILDVIMFDILYPQEAKKEELDFYQNTVLSARSIGKKYDYNEAHADKVEEFVLKIFDEIQKIHGLGRRARNLLQVATILHDVGKFISLKRHYYNSYDLIRSSNILGLNNRETEIVANIARYHSSKVPREKDRSYHKLRREDRILMSKLVSILRLAEALDRGHRDKFNSLAIKLKEDQLMITIITNEPTLLEEWSFQQKSNLFEEVFGIKTKLKKKERW
ncbi:MAG: HD domain-containing protein [Halanaerobacter sp.]